MKRITYKDAAGRWVIACNKFWNWIENKLPAHLRGEAVDRLAAIEEVLGDEYDLDRLRDLVEADKAGRCVVLPCKPGDVVWKICDQCDFPGDCYTSQKCDGCEYRSISVEKRIFSISMLNQYGKFGHPYYKTYEAAESALAKETSHE